MAKSASNPVNSFSPSHEDLAGVLIVIKKHFPPNQLNTITDSLTWVKSRLWRGLFQILLFLENTLSVLTQPLILESGVRMVRSRTANLSSHFDQM